MVIDSATRSIAKVSVLVIICVVSFAASSFAQDEEVLKVDTDLVNIETVVTDHAGRPVRGLKREDFEVYEDGERQEVTHFAASARPVRLVLLFDTSFSMEDVLPVMKQEAVELSEGLLAEDEVLVASFDCEPRAHTGWLSKQGIKDGIDGVRPGQTVCDSPPPHVPLPTGRSRVMVDGNTRLYEALRCVFERFGGAGERVAVVVLTDGVDRASRLISVMRERAKMGEHVARRAEESWAMIYPVLFKTSQVKTDLPEPSWRPPLMRGVQLLKPKFTEPGREFLIKVAKVTGGKDYEFAARHDLAAAMREALADLRSRYSLAYTPREKNKDGFRRIKVRVKRPDLVARALDGYRVVR